MSKELEQLMETLTTERSIFELKQLLIDTPVVREVTQPRFINSCVDISQFQKRGSLVDQSQYRKR
jgi:hypothetical protein